MRTALALLAVLVAAAPAAAGRDPAHGATHPKRPTSPKRPAPVVAGSPALDVAAAVASGDLDRQCGVALALVAAKQHAHASLLVGTCATLPARADAARAARIAIAKAAERAAWSTVELVVRGDDRAAVTVDAFPDVPLAAGTWQLPAGTYRFTAHTVGGDVASELTIATHSRALVLLDAPTTPAAPPPRHGTVDFTDDSAPIEAPIAGPPPATKRPSLLPARYLKLFRACGAMACRQAP
ncbi:MAG: hypothetical protein R3B06_03500 [Kofleriaceae bacterium]